MAQDVSRDAVAERAEMSASTPEAQEERSERVEEEEGRFNFNTLAMAGLAVIFVVFSVSLLSGIIYEQDLDEFGYPVEVVDAAPVVEDEGPAFDPVLPLLASADPAAGETIFRKCSSCHSAGDENKVGPGLGGVVNRAIAGHPGFGYSGALQAHAAEAPAWTYSELNAFLWKPKTWVPGTSMGFAGLADVQERADVIAYLRQISGDPPLPTEEEIAAATATDEVAEGAAVDATTDGAVGDAGVSGAPLATDVETGQGVPGNETAADSPVDPDDLRDPGATDEDPAAAVAPNGEVIDDAVADDAAAAGVPVAPLPGDTPIDGEDVRDAAGEPATAPVAPEITPVAPVAPGLAEPEVEGVVVDPAPDAAVVVPDATVADPAAPAVAPAAPVTDPAAPVVVPEQTEGGVRTYSVPIDQ